MPESDLPELPELPELEPLLLEAPGPSATRPAENTNLVGGAIVVILVGYGVIPSEPEMMMAWTTVLMALPHVVTSIVNLVRNRKLPRV